MTTDMSKIDPLLLGDNKQDRQQKDINLVKEKLQNRLEILERENQKFLKEKQKLNKKQELERQDYESILDLLKQESADYKRENATMEFKYLNEKKENDELENELKTQLENKKRDYDDQKQELNDKIKYLEQRLDQISSYLDDKHKLEEETEELKQLLEKEKKEKKRVLADQEREKVQATDKLSKDMNHKIEETKVQLLALKKEQITTTNRLTVLQNHQLTTELEYQSKQTEKLLFRNNKLNEQIASLKRNIEIHKQVEQELAKRSQNAQKQIKNLSQDIKEIEEKNENLKKERDQLLEPEEHEIMQQKQQEEIIEELEKQLETSEKKYAKVTNDLELLRNEQFYLQSKIENSENKSQNFAQILAHCLENLRNNQPGVYDDLASKDVEINQDFLEKIRQKDVLEWEQDEKETVIFYLINKVKSLITKKTLLEFSHIPEHLEIEIVQSNDTDVNQQNQSQNQTQNQSLFQKYNEYTQQQQDNKTNAIKQFKYNPNSNKNSNTFLPKIQSQGSRNNLDDYNNSLNNDSKNKYNINNNSSINNNNQQNQSVNSALNRFKGLPIDVSTQIVKGNVREWGKQAMTMPSNNKKAMQVQRRFKMI